MNDSDPLESLLDLVTEEIRKRMEVNEQDAAQQQEAGYRLYYQGIQRGYDIVLFELYQAQNEIKKRTK